MHFDWLSRKSDAWVALCIAFVACTALLVVQPFTLVNGDEGIYVLYALLMQQDLVPIADYDARTPLLLVAINLSQSAFGDSILSYRLPVILATALTAGVLFLLGKEMFSRRAGVIAGLLYALNPYVLWSDGILKSEMFTILFATLSALFFVKALKDERWYWYLLTGVMIGCAFLERHSGIVPGAFVMSVLVWRRSHLVRPLALVSVGFALGFLPVFLWIGFENLSNAIHFWFGISYDLVSLQAGRSLAVTNGLLSYALIRDWGLLMVEDLAPQGWILFLGLVGFLFAAARSLIVGAVGRWLGFGVAMLFLGAFIEHALGVYFTESDLRPEVFLAALIAACICVVPFLRWLLPLKRFQELFYERDMMILIISWMLGFVILYSFWTPTYLRELVVPITLATAFLISKMPFEQWTRVSRIFFVAGCAGLYISSLWWFTNPLTGGWWWRQDTMNAAAHALKTVIVPHERVLGANPLPIFLAGGQIFQDMSSYGIIHATDFSEPWGLYLSPADFYTALEQNPPRYAVVDGRMRAHIYQPFPVFQNFVEARYHKVAEFGYGKDNTQIWQRID